MTTPQLRTVGLPGGEALPALGQGTWHMAEQPAARLDEIAALQEGLEVRPTSRFAAWTQSAELRFNRLR
jgi:hypothetical protein